jgi:hypothetical protein
MKALATRHSWIVPTCLWLAAIIHLLPLPGLLGAAQLQSLYGLGDLDPASELLLRHRALMFALFGALLISATRVHPLRPAAIALTLISDLGFLLLALGGPHLPALQRVVYFDALSIVLLLTAALLVGAQRIGTR